MVYYFDVTDIMSGQFRTRDISFLIVPVVVQKGFVPREWILLSRQMASCAAAEMATKDIYPNNSHVAAKMAAKDIYPNNSRSLYSVYQESHFLFTS